MADCTSNFKYGDISYLRRISLTQGKIEQLVKSSNALREDIRGHLINKGLGRPKFYRQGSYAQKTLIVPINEDYDIDDGIYLDLNAANTTLSTSTIHKWVCDAVEGHTQIPPKDKDPCVRAIFKDGYHVDLPIYKIETNEHNSTETYYLAKKSTGWEQSDPRATNAWFEGVVSQHSEQVRHLVKYSKAWADYRDSNTTTKLPSGFTLTILVGEQCRSDTREDIAFLETMRAIKSRLEANNEIWKPYEPTENMTNYLSTNQLQHFLHELNTLVSAGDNAIKETSRKQAALSWREVLGNRFPVFDDQDGDSSTSAKQWAAPAIIGTTVKSAQIDTFTQGTRNCYQ